MLSASTFFTPWSIAASMTLVAADDVGLDRLDRVVFAGRHLLQRGGVDDDIDAVKGALEPIAIAHVADEVAHRRVPPIGKHLPHLVLLQLVAAEDDQLFGRYSLSMIAMNF